MVDAKQYGADFIEIGGIENISRDAFFALADEAKKQGIPLAGHVPVSVSVEEASNAGLKSIDDVPSELDVEILPACSSREHDLLELWREAFAKRFAMEQQSETPTERRERYRARMQLALDTYDQQKAEALFSLLKANHTWLCPTLAARRNFMERSSARDPRVKFVSPKLRKWWNDNPYWNPKDWGSADDAVMTRAYRKYFDPVAAARRAGVEFIAGTTGEEPFFNVPGFGLHDELAVLVQAGLSPWRHCRPPR